MDGLVFYKSYLLELNDALFYMWWRF